MDRSEMQGLQQVNTPTAKSIPGSTMVFLTHLNNVLNDTLLKILQQEATTLNANMQRFLLGELNRPINSHMALGITEIEQMRKKSPVVLDAPILSSQLCQRFYNEVTSEHMSGLSIDIDSLSLTSRSQDEYDVELEKATRFLLGKTNNRKMASQIARVKAHSKLDFDEHHFPLYPKAVLMGLMLALKPYYEEDSLKQIVVLHALTHALQLQGLDKHFDALMLACKIPEAVSFISKVNQATPAGPGQAQAAEAAGNNLPANAVTGNPSAGGTAMGNQVMHNNPPLQDNGAGAAYYQQAQGYARIQPEYLAQQASNMRFVSRSVEQIPLSFAHQENSHLLQQLPQTDVISALNQFAAQQNFSANDVMAITPASMRSFLRANVPTGYKYAQQDTNIMDTVSALFDALLNDKTLPNLVKVLLSRLQITFLQVALQDPLLFQNPNHPARTTLNQMATLGMHWDKKALARNNVLFGFLVNCVSAIMQNYATDANIFVATNHKIDEFAKNFFAKQNLQEQKAVKAAKEKSKMLALEQLVDRTIKQVILHQKLPLCVLQLVQSGWRKVLMAQAMASDVAKPNWQAEVATLEQLVQSVTPDSNNADWFTQMAAERAPLYARLKAGLEFINFDVVWLDKLLLALGKIHDELLATQAKHSQDVIEVLPAAEMAETAETTSPVNLKDITAVSQINVRAIVIDDDKEALAVPQIDIMHPMMIKTHHMPVNTLVDFKTDNQDAPTRLKLVARLHVGSQLIFTNAQGIRAKQISENDFAQLLIDNQVSIIVKQGAVVDDALQKIVRALDKVAV